MAKVNFSTVGILVQERPGNIQELVTSEEPQWSHQFEFHGNDGEYGVYGIYPMGSVREGYASFNPGRTNYFMVTLETPIENQLERTFNQRLGEILQAKNLRLMPWKDGSNPMVNLVNQAGPQTFMQPGEIEEFQTLPEPGPGQAKLTKGMSVSKPSGYWTVVISAPADFGGSNANRYLQRILEVFEEVATPMIQQGLLEAYYINNKSTHKTVKEVWSEQGKLKADSEERAHQQAINYLYHLADTILKPFPHLQAEFIKAIQWRVSTKPNSDTPSKIDLYNDPTVKMLLEEEMPIFRMALKALFKMETDNFLLLDKAMTVYSRLYKDNYWANKIVGFLLALEQLHNQDEQIDKDIECLQQPETVGWLLTFGLMRNILGMAPELTEAGFGPIVEKVKNAAVKGLEALTKRPDTDSLRYLLYEPLTVLNLKNVIAIPDKILDLLNKASEADTKKTCNEINKSIASNKKMDYSSVETYLKSNGLCHLAGGKKYSYWGLNGTPINNGVFIRLSQRTVRLVARSKIGSKINDLAISKEIYFGKLKPEILTHLIDKLKKRGSAE